MVMVVEFESKKVELSPPPEGPPKRKLGRPMSTTPASVVQLLTTCSRPKGSATRKWAKAAMKTGEVKRIVVASDSGMYV